MKLHKGIRVLLALDKLSQQQGGNIHNFIWRLSTGRLPIEKEWELIIVLEANSLPRVHKIVASYLDNWSFLASASLQELRDKGYITDRDLQEAEGFLPFTK